ncbi:hypothetical protein GOP47_0016555 [Adiantum capillus-veneris]|uniref:RING-type E3 ubiquitin transferase BRCA1 n=1 Tax=Adiantum capillus-veneris TaxID=13818 RepID=A0A9D4UHX4_ADICA|nr:hypothetical protein GOP47_0016555 [Adiantum capillus-veneris]
MVRTAQAGLRVCDVLQEDTTVLASDGASCSGLQRCKIPEMGPVIASITGYVGDERSTLIKLINSSGACYVGKLIKGSITHLVCWTFDGPKYEMAKRFQICIVNHRWFEDCCKAGKRLDESPYTILSGKEVGAVLWKAPMYESSSHNVQSKLGLSLKHAYNKDHLPGNARAEDFYEVQLYPGGDSILSSERASSDEILNVSDDNYELQLLLENKPTQRNRGKSKTSLIMKNRCITDKPVPKHKRKLIASPTSAERRKYADSRDRITHSMLEYVHLIDDMEEDNNQNCRPHLQVDDFEGRDVSPFTNRTKTWGQKSLNLLSSMRHRKKRRLVRKTEIMKAHNSFDSEGAMALSPEVNKTTPRREVMQDERASSRSPGCVDAIFYKNAENLNGSPVACTLIPADIDCAICHTDHITSAGVLSCGHHFCYQCIMKWALEVASKTPTCPLCKGPFDMITKREKKPGSSEKELSYEESVIMLNCLDRGIREQLEESTPILSCIMCGNGDMQDLLLTCIGCGARSAHTFCLDPPLPPLSNTRWSCGRCLQRRRADTTWWHQLHLFDS